MIEVFLSTALLCFGGECWPVLTGNATPLGEYSLEYKLTKQRGYGGDILLFADRPDGWFAIHRTYPGREHMYDLEPEKRRHISHGCINVPPHLYETLKRATRLVVAP